MTFFVIFGIVRSTHFLPRSLVNAVYTIVSYVNLNAKSKTKTQHIITTSCSLRTNSIHLILTIQKSFYTNLNSKAFFYSASVNQSMTDRITNLTQQLLAE